MTKKSKSLQLAESFIKDENDPVYCWQGWYIFPKTGIRLTDGDGMLNCIIKRAVEKFPESETIPAMAKNAHRLIDAYVDRLTDIEHLFLTLKNQWTDWAFVAHCQTEDGDVIKAEDFFPKGRRDEFIFYEDDAFIKTLEDEGKFRWNQKS